MAITDIDYNIKESLLFVTANDNTPMAKAGRVWALFDHEILGALAVCGIHKPEVKWRQESEFMLTSCKAVGPNRKSVLLGDNEGGLYLFQAKKAPARIETSIKSILFMYSFAERIYLIGLDAIKVLDAKTLAVIGGGRLNQRLNNKDIKCSALDEIGKRLFIATSKHVFLFDISEAQPKFVDVLDPIPTGIAQITYSKGNLFITRADGKAVGVWKLQQTTKLKIERMADFILPEDSEIGDEGVTCAQYHSGYRMLIGGTTAGKLVFWDANDGRIKSVISAHDCSVTCLKLAEESDYLFSGSSRGKVKTFIFSSPPKSEEIDPADR
eukprot:TRINITY_DN9922_c0_g1_i3.p1 TRINITY_DN9922_c0_g1~~TRINITY_DN9922_c0_g1_i3.p1  ORF type:complete len:325 (+),score=61.47 TRINITY_DN9922_c0_g1_i3:346-1320(+)